MSIGVEPVVELAAVAESDLLVVGDSRRAGDSSDLLARFPSAGPRVSSAATAILLQLTAHSRAALLIAALSTGDEVHEIVAATELFLGCSVTVDCLSSVPAAGLVNVRDDRVTFPDRSVRGAVAQFFPPSQIRAADHAWSRILPHAPARRAWHTAYAAGRPDERVARDLEWSVRESDRRGDPVDSLRRLDKSARLSPEPEGRARRLLAAGRKAFELGHPDVAERLLREAEQWSNTAGLRSISGTLHALFSARVPRQIPAISEHCAAAARLVNDQKIDAALDLLAVIAQATWCVDRTSAGSSELSRCLDLVPDGCRDHRFLVARAITAPGAARGAVESASVGPDDAEACRLIGIAALATGDLVRATDLLAIAADRLRADGLRGSLAQIQAMFAQAALALGDWDSAQRAVDEAVDLTRATQQRTWELYALGIRALLTAHRGRPFGALSEVDEVDRAAAGHPISVVLASVRLARAIAMMNAGEWTDAYDTLRNLLSRNTFGFCEALAPIALGYLAEAALHTGRTDDARSILTSLADVRASAVLSVNLSYARALLASPALAQERFSEAGREIPGQWPWMHARLELSYGSWLRRQGRVTEARAQLQSARHTLQRLGAAAWHSRAQGELRAAGVDIVMTTSTLPCRLSPQELRIAQLAGTGLTNREIGERLFLSSRTIGSHLYRIFPKLDVTARSQLAGRLAGLPVPTDPGDS